MYHCLICNSPLKSMCSVGADMSASGYTETLASCTNDDCALDWNIQTTREGKVVKIEQYFFG